MRTPHLDTYHDSMSRFVDIFDRSSRRLSVRAGSRRKLARWQRRARRELGRLLGLDLMEKAPAFPRPEAPERCDGFTRQKVLIQTEPGVDMSLELLFPEDMRQGERRPCVIATHGHGGGGRLAVSGHDEIPAIKDAIARCSYDYGVTLARQGYVVACPDARGFGERRELPKQGDGEELFMSCSCSAVNNMALGLGRCVTGIWTWELMRLVDYLASRDDCYPSRIGCVGFSSGGQQALWLSAMDERVRCAVVSGYFYGYRDSLLMLPGNCSCNYVPGLWRLMDMGDIGALIAPRPLLVETGTEDPLNGSRGVANAAEQVAMAREAYEACGRADLPRHVVRSGGHRWYGDETPAFLASALRA